MKITRKIIFAKADTYLKCNFFFPFRCILCRCYYINANLRISYKRGRGTTFCMRNRVWNYAQECANLKQNRKIMHNKKCCAGFWFCSLTSFTDIWFPIPSRIFIGIAQVWGCSQLFFSFFVKFRKVSSEKKSRSRILLTGSVKDS